MDNAPPYVIEMLHITKEFPGIKANDDITLQLKKGEITIDNDFSKLASTDHVTLNLVK